MNCAIFIRSYRSDREWLSFCLRSLKKFAHGFTEVIIALPTGDEPHFDAFDTHGGRIVWETDPPEVHGYLAQQIAKLYADTHTDADYILFADSDCFSTYKFRPDDWCWKGKPFQLIRHWSEVGHAICWKEPTSLALGVEPIFEHMAALPIIHDRRLFPLLRAHVEKLHQKSMRDYVSSVQSFSEFNVMGSFALRYLPHLYEWRIADPPVDGYPRPFVQGWSHGGVDAHRETYETMLA